MLKIAKINTGEEVCRYCKADATKQVVDDSGVIDTIFMCDACAVIISETIIQLTVNFIRRMAKQGKI